MIGLLDFLSALESRNMSQAVHDWLIILCRGVQGAQLPVEGGRP